MFKNKESLLSNLGLLTGTLVISGFTIFSLVKSIRPVDATASCIVTIFGKQYDVAPLNHSGGNNIFVCGTDMTSVYQGQHGTDVSRIASFLVSTPSLTPTTTPAPTASPTITPVPSISPTTTPSVTVTPTVSPTTTPSVKPFEDDDDDEFENHEAEHKEDHEENEHHHNRGQNKLHQSSNSLLKADNSRRHDD